MSFAAEADSLSPRSQFTTITGVAAAQPSDHAQGEDSQSPLLSRPPVSPITPTAASARLHPANDLHAPSSPEQPVFIERPLPLPFSESDNTDVIALRSAIALLQVQRDRSKRDIQTLQKLKEAHAEEPDLFAEQLLAGKLNQARNPSNPLHATFVGDCDDDDAEEEVEASASEESSRFPKLPMAQDVFRCPPINWAKYHVLGAALDRMHDEQRRNPTTGGTTRDEHVVAAPYSPWQDKPAPVEQAHPMQTRKGSKKPVP